MKVKGLGILGAALLVAALLVGLTGVVLAALQVWYLNDTTTTPGYEMERESWDSADSYVTLANGANVIWIADEAAEVNVAFCAGDWETDLFFETAPQTTADGLTVHIGTSTGAVANFTSKGSLDHTCDGDKHQQPKISASAFTVIQDDYLAFRLYNNTGSSVDVTTGDVYQSRISGPECDPGYPTPELSTIILTGAGLAALGGFIWLRRRKAAAIQA